MELLLSSLLLLLLLKEAVLDLLHLPLLQLEPAAAAKRRPHRPATTAERAAGGATDHLHLLLVQVPLLLLLQVPLLLLLHKSPPAARPPLVGQVPVPGADLPLGNDQLEPIRLDSVPDRHFRSFSKSLFMGNHSPFLSNTAAQLLSITYFSLKSEASNKSGSESQNVGFLPSFLFRGRRRNRGIEYHSADC